MLEIGRRVEDIDTVAVHVRATNRRTRERATQIIREGLDNEVVLSSAQAYEMGRIWARSVMRRWLERSIRRQWPQAMRCGGERVQWAEVGYDFDQDAFHYRAEARLVLNPSPEWAGRRREVPDEVGTVSFAV